MAAHDMQQTELNLPLTELGIDPARFTGAESGGNA
jgi:hypothetical protein